MQSKNYIVHAVLLLASLGSGICLQSISYESIEKTQQRNMEILEETLPQGWAAFCRAPVDEGVMSLYNGINPSDGLIHVLTLNNQSIVLPVKALSEIRDYDINPRRKTLVYINGYYTPDSYFSIQAHLKLMQHTRRDYNIIVLDFASDLAQLYFTVRHHVPLLGYFTSKVLALLVANGVAPRDITLAGHSVGANIAALGARLFTEQTRASKLGQLIAVDPALMCSPADVHVQAHLSNRVVVIHGEGDLFGIREPLGTVDIYPNGIGYFPRRKLQPGCDTRLCSHMYAFVLFMEAVIEGLRIPAVKCDSWVHFRTQQCDYDKTLTIGLQYNDTMAPGVYFCLTQPNPPFKFLSQDLENNKRNIL